jgi:muramoyltetrapeptide carboxypeptidase
VTSSIGWTIVDVLQDRLGTLGVPIVGGIFAGHDLTGADGGPDQIALPLGPMANLDADTGTISFTSMRHDARASTH